jgi:hypothetical protein
LSQKLTLGQLQAMSAITPKGGVQRTSRGHATMPAYDPKRTFAPRRCHSAWILIR